MKINSQYKSESVGPDLAQPNKNFWRITLNDTIVVGYLKTLHNSWHVVGLKFFLYFFISLLIFKAFSNNNGWNPKISISNLTNIYDDAEVFCVLQIISHSCKNQSIGSWVLSDISKR